MLVNYPPDMLAHFAANPEMVPPQLREKLKVQEALNTNADDTPLIDAVRHGRAADVTALLADGADVDAPKTDGTGITALHVACHLGDVDAATTLLAAQADVNALTVTGIAAIFVACEQGNASIVTALIAHGANANTELSFGLAPL